MTKLKERHASSRRRRRAGLRGARPRHRAGLAGQALAVREAEEPPFFGADHKARRACAIAADDGITVNEVGIDGTTYDISAYRVQSQDHKVRLPADDLFGLDASTMRFTADGWAALIEPLPPGHHVITVRSAGEFPGSGGPIDSTATLQLDVRR